MNEEDAVKELIDKVAVVTGDASGIGKSIGPALAEKGTHVVVADIEPDKAEAAAREIARPGLGGAVRCRRPRFGGTAGRARLVAFWPC